MNTCDRHSNNKRPSIRSFLFAVRTLINGLIGLISIFIAKKIAHVSSSELNAIALTVSPILHCYSYKRS